MPPQSQQDPDQILPRQDIRLFIQVQKLYDSKQFEKAIKTADVILKNHPKHGETLSMKGLLCNQLGRKEEAHKLCKQGLTHNLRSPTCWHVYGLVHKSDRNYSEAIKCFKNAIRMDGPHSQNSSMILRDLSQMQLQQRDFKGFLDSRTKYLNTDRNMQFTSAWISLALAHHLLKNYEQAAKVLQQFRQAKGASLPALSYELSEMYMYEAYIYQDGGMFEKALEVLDRAGAEGVIRDVIGSIEMRAQLLVSLGMTEEARDVYYALLEENPEDHRYHRQIIDLERRGALAVSGNDDTNDVSRTADANHANDATRDVRGVSYGDIGNENTLEQIYEDLIRKYPKSRSCKRIPLDFDLSDELFKARLRDFVTPYIQKGIPSLFAELEPLHANAEKSRMIGETLAELHESMVSSSESNESFWIGLCRAMHYSRVAQDEDAIQMIDQVISIAPDDDCRIDAYSAKSKILDAIGDYAGAAEMAENARKLDLADRYLNCRASTAFFKSLQAERAEDLCQLFTKGGNNNFYDMQATWYEMASGNCYAKLGDFGQALKRFRKVVEHYNDFIEDQYDFFVYCTSKQTMRSYVDMIRMMDNLFSSEILASAVESAVRVYIHLSKCPYKTELEQLEELAATMEPGEADRERKRLKDKLKNEEKREQERKRDEEKAAAENKGASNADVDKKVDSDPKGLLLAKTKDPLGDAKQLVNILLTGAPNKLISHLLAYWVDVRRLSAGDVSFSLLLEHVRSAVSVGGSSHPRVHECIIDLAVRLSESENEAADNKGLNLAVADLLGGKTVADYHSAWKLEGAESSDLELIVVAAKIDDLLDVTGDKEAVWNACAERLKAHGVLRRAGHESCLGILDELVADEKMTGSQIFRKACGDVFTSSQAFGVGEPNLHALSLSS